jgi:hypothetical protein
LRQRIQGCALGFDDLQPADGTIWPWSSTFIEVPLKSRGVGDND